MGEKQLNLEEYGIQKKEDGTLSFKNPSINAEKIGKIGTVMSAVILNAQEKIFNGEKKVMLTLNIPDLEGYDDGNIRSFGLNLTNLVSMINAYGEDLEEWLNKSIELKVEKTKFGGESTSGIRVYATD
jgi:hypothetical protein